MVDGSKMEDDFPFKIGGFFGSILIFRAPGPNRDNQPQPPQPKKLVSLPEFLNLDL